MRCPSCDEPGHLEVGAPRQAATGEVAGVLEDPWLLRCPRGHVLPATARPELRARVRERCLATIPQARRRWLREARCAACSGRLTMPGRRTQRTVTVDGIDPLPAFRLHFDLPMTRCPDCGHDQLDAASQAAFAEVVNRLCG